MPKKVAAVNICIQSDKDSGKVVMNCPDTTPSGVSDENTNNSVISERCDQPFLAIRLKNTNDSIALCARIVIDKVVCRDALFTIETAKPSMKQWANSKAMSHCWVNSCCLLAGKWINATIAIMISAYTENSMAVWLCS